MKLIFRRYNKNTDYNDLIKIGFSKKDIEKSTTSGLKYKLSALLGIYKRQLFVAYSPDDKKVVGTILLKRRVDIDFRWCMNSTWEENVLPEFRRRGIMTFLHAEVANLLREKGVDRFYVTVDFDNPTSYDYHKHGKGKFKEIGEMFYFTGAIPKENRWSKVLDKKNVWLREYDQKDQVELYNIYNSCVVKKINDFFEITNKNFLGPNKLTSKILINLLKLSKQYYKKTIMLGIKNKILGYATIASTTFFKGKTNIVNVYMMKDENYLALIENMLGRCFEILRHRGEGDIICNIWCSSDEVSLLTQIEKNTSMKLTSQYIFGWYIN
jgi:GNAT superfamily N-acetyltransferase